MDNHVRKDQIMVHINRLAHVSEESILRMKTELKVEIKEEIQAFEGCMITRIEELKSSIDYLGSNNFIFMDPPLKIERKGD